MKHIRITYWFFSIIIIGLILIRLTSSFIVALLMLTSILPIIIIIEYLIKGINFSNSSEIIKPIISLILFVFTIQLLLSILVHRYLDELGFKEENPIIFNPIFIVLIVITFITIERLGKGYIKRFLPNEDLPNKLSFTSDRKKIEIDPIFIVLVESCDSEVWIHTTDHSYRTKMNISSWEEILDERFVRIHRSFIVNKLHITEYKNNTIYIDNKALEISRKYKDSAKQKLKEQNEINHFSGEIDA